jgi:gliding motility-associated-like protein
LLKNILIILGFLMLTHAKIAAQDGSANLEFIENKGQWNGAILFKGELNNGAFFLQKKGFTVLLHNPEELARMREHNRFSRVAGSPNDTGAIPKKNAVFYSDTSMLHSHAYSMSFRDGNENVTVIPDKPLPSYNNYFIGNDRSRWASNCKLYQAVTYKNVYPNIDIRYYTHEGQLKYDIVIHPGGDINRIALKYEGVDKLTLKNRRLIVKTSVGEVQELSPQSYQYNTSGRKEIECRYVLGKDNIVRFAAKNYSAGTTLVIDPSLVFSTFTGSRASNWGFTATPGPDGTFFAGGIVFGEGFPVSPGAFQSNFHKGTTDVGIIKFSSNGANRIYATYIGGGDNETPHSLFSDPQGNLVVLGRTYSTDFPTLTRVGNLGGADMFVLKLSAGGNALIGSMRIGGVRDDCVNIEDQFRAGSEKAISLIRNYGDDTRSEVVLDRSNTIYVAASTRSPDFPVTAGAFQTGFGGGNQDGVVLKISADCSTVLFSSFLGGTGDDAAFVLKVNPINNNIYVAGATASPDFPGNKSGTLQGTYQGGISDGFISIISNDGSSLQKTTFQGTSGSESIYGIEFDKKGFPYIMGTTTGNWTVTNNVGFVNAGAKQFVSKLQPDLSAYIYSTTFGNPANAPNISPVAFLVDRCENVYVSGWGGWIFARTDPYGLSGSFGMPVTPDALKAATDGRDFYFIVIKKNASALLYATFFGQLDGPQSISEHVDGGTSRYDQFGVIYQAICANCNGGNLGPFPTTPGSWSPRNGTASGNSVGGCNLAAVKIAFNFAGVAAGLKSFINGRYDSSGCIPLQVTFDDTIKNAKQYIWNFGDMSPDTMTTGFQVSHTYNNVGTYRVMLIAIDSNSCNISDTVYETIRARTDRAGINFTATKLPPCQSLTYQFENFSTAPPGKPFGPNSFSWDFGDGSPQDTAGLVTVVHTYLSAGTYIARLKMIDTTYCNYPDELTDTLRVAPLVKAQFITPAAGCAPYNAVFDNTSLAGQQFFWDFGDGSTSTASSPTHFYPNVGNFTIKLVAIDSATCNIIDSTSTNITVSPKPQAAFTFTPSPPAPNQPTVFFNSSVGATHYLWIFGDGDTAIKASADTVIHQYQQTGTFQACLVAFNVFECPDTVCHPVETIVNPLLDVPNAFTPGRFGQNSVIRVQGFGISRMIFRIYNRWGQMVFESNNPNQGWDGTYKGNPQPMDVYGYTLEAAFFDGKKTTRTGDITLIR